MDEEKEKKVFEGSNSVNTNTQKLERQGNPHSLQNVEFTDI